MNTKSVLVTYATRYGSTKEAAEIIVDALRQSGLQVDFQPVREVSSLDRYDAVVLGAAIYNTRWHSDAHEFLSHFADVLRQHPVAIFSLGPTTRNPATKKQSLSQLNKDLEKYRWLKPVAFEMFVGRYDLSKLGIGSVRRIIPLSDQRNPSAVRAWANTLPAEFERNEMSQLA